MAIHARIAGPSSVRDLGRAGWLFNPPRSQSERLAKIFGLLLFATFGIHHLTEAAQPPKPNYLQPQSPSLQDRGAALPSVVPAPAKTTLGPTVRGEDAKLSAWCFLTNDQVVIGVDPTRGACVGYFARRDTGRNVLNHYDTGRFVQQSYYGDADGSSWGRQPWRYNPVQGGGYRQEWPAETLSLTRSKEELHARVRPRHWGTGKELPEVLMEEWIRLEGEVARIRFRMTYSGEDHTEIRDQEMPAVFADFAFDELVTYQGSLPWQHGSVKHLAVAASDPPRNEYLRRDEEWSAWIEKASQWGLGVYTPGSSGTTYYRYGGGKQNGPNGSRCSYFAPLRKFRLTKGLVVDYELYLTIGSVDQIRSTFERMNASPPKSP